VPITKLVALDLAGPSNADFFIQFPNVSSVTSFLQPIEIQPNSKVIINIPFFKIFKYVTVLFKVCIL